MLSLQYNLDLLPNSKWNTVNATATAKASFLYAQEIGDFYAGPQYFTTRSGFHSYLLKMTVDGCGILEYEGQRYQVPAGHLFWIDCTKQQHYYTDPEAGHWHVLWVHFCGANAQSYYEAFLNGNHGSAVAPFPLHLSIPDTFSNLLAVGSTQINQLQADIVLSGLLTNLISHCAIANAVSPKKGDTPQLIQSVRLYLQNNYKEKHTLEDLGARFNINPFYLQKQFKRHTGQSPTEYLIYLRINRAKELMRSTRRSIGEIAYMVGIENTGYFTRLFKQQEGMTPQEYRKLWPFLEHGLTEET